MLTKEELLSTAQAENIPLNETKLRRFIQYGLIVSNRKGQGRARGVTHASLHERSLETLKEIERLKGIKQENLILTLYWNGYPVVWYKLRDSLHDYVRKLNMTYVQAAKLTNDPLNAEYAATEMAKEAMPLKRPGRPSRDEEDAMQQRLANEIAFMHAVIGMIQELGTNKSVTPATLKNFFELFATVSGAWEDMVRAVVEWVNPKLLLSGVIEADEHDFVNVYEIVRCLRDYWSDLKDVVGEPLQLPMLKAFVDKVTPYFASDFMEGSTHFQSYILLVLLALRQHSQIQEFLQSDTTRQAFREECLQLKQFSEATKGGDGL